MDQGCRHAHWFRGDREAGIVSPELFDIELEKAITDTMERRNDAKDALQELVIERDSENRSPGELVGWAADLQLCNDAVELEERRLTMLRRQR